MGCLIIQDKWSTVTEFASVTDFLSIDCTILSMSHYLTLFAMTLNQRLILLHPWTSITLHSPPWQPRFCQTWALGDCFTFTHPRGSQHLTKALTRKCILLKWYYLSFQTTPLSPGCSIVTDFNVIFNFHKNLAFPFPPSQKGSVMLVVSYLLKKSFGTLNGRKTSSAWAHI